MAHLDAIEKASQKLIALCQKETQTKSDKKKMLEIQAEILESIENLTECERCGAISEMIVTITLADDTAKLCKACGIKSLETGKIQSSKQRASRKPTRRAKTPATSSAKPKPKTAGTRSKSAGTTKKPETPAELHTRVEAETGIKKTDIRRLHKIVQDIAAPMSPEHTLTYVQREAEIAKIKVEAADLEKAVTFLMDNASQAASTV